MIKLTLTSLLSLWLDFAFTCAAQPKTEVLLVGSYHMAGTDDPLKVDSDNMLSAKRQKEINEVLDLLQTYQPTKIFIEDSPSKQAHWDSSYVLAEKGILPNDGWAGSESYQLGTRLAQRLKLPKSVICVHWRPSDDVTNNSAFDTLYRNYQNAVGKQYESLKADDNVWWTEKAKLILADIQKLYVDVVKLPVREALILLNDQDLQKKLYYVNNVMVMDKNAHRMGVATALPNVVRNLYIYTNIMSNITPSDQRVLIIYGVGHVESLRHMFEGNSQLKLVPFSAVIK